MMHHLIAKMEEVDARNAARFAELNARLDRLDAAFASHQDLVARVNALKADNRATRWIVVIALVASVLASALLVISVQANLLSTLKAGPVEATSPR